MYAIPANLQPTTVHLANPIHRILTSSTTHAFPLACQHSTMLVIQQDFPCACNVLLHAKPAPMPPIASHAWLGICYQVVFAVQVVLWDTISTLQSLDAMLARVIASFAVVYLSVSFAKVGTMSIASIPPTTNACRLVQHITMRTVKAVAVNSVSIRASSAVQA